MRTLRDISERVQRLQRHNLGGGTLERSAGEEMGLNKSIQGGRRAWQCKLRELPSPRAYMMLNAIERARGIELFKKCNNARLISCLDVGNFCGVMKAEISGLWGANLAIKRRTEMRRYLRLGHKVRGVLCFLCHFLKVKVQNVYYTGGSLKEGKEVLVHGLWGSRQQQN